MLAQNLENIQKKAFESNLEFKTIGAIFSQNTLKYIFAAAGILLLLYLLSGGIQIMFSAGDPKKMEAARGKITNAVVGFVIVFIAFWLTQLVGTLFNIQVIENIFLNL
ncbi:hypothetical protein ACFL1Q_00920 [Patescibacteria group bacterium]